MDKTKFKVQWLPYVLLCVFAVCSALALFMNGDDYLWYYSAEDEALASWRTPNGRFFSNLMTIWLVRSIPFRTVFIAVTFALFLIVMARLFDHQMVMKGAGCYMTLLLLIFIPHATYAETINWISGYTNYVFSMLLLFVYLMFMFRCICGDFVPKAYSALLFIPLALAGGLCVEHVTIYNVILGAAMIVLVIKLKKKCLPHAAAFLLGAVAACVIMFSSSIYSSIYSEGDTVGNRYFEVGFANIMQNAYSFVVMHYTKDFWAVPLAVTAAFTWLYIKKDTGEKKPKYLRACMAICWLYAAYAVYTMCHADLRPNTPAMKIVALETAFSFLYAVAVAYLINVYLDKNGKIRAYIYLVSTFLLTAPFLVISPATARCYFANYMFWILLSGEVISCAVKSTDIKKLKPLRGALSAAALAAAFLLTFMCFSNKYYDSLRFDYIKEQLTEKGNKKVALILLPYMELNHDDLTDGLYSGEKGVGEFYYADYILKYHDIDPDDVEGLVETKASPYDYHIAKMEAE